MLRASVSLPEGQSCLGREGKVVGSTQARGAGSELELPLPRERFLLPRARLEGGSSDHGLEWNLKTEWRGGGACAGPEPPSLPRLLLRIAWEN